MLTCLLCHSELPLTKQLIHLDTFNAKDSNQIAYVKIYYPGVGYFRRCNDFSTNGNINDANKYESHEYFHKQIRFK